jgi:serine/threonine protein kinase/tetratricopeptide (TPR) repeat protein
MIGKTISHYKVLEKLGEGGMGVVYRAEDTRLKRTVALKFLPPELTRDSEAKARFMHEAQAAAALSHSNICTVYEIDEVEGQIFIATECIEGETLKGKIAAGPIKIDEALNIVIQVAEGLEKAHENGTIHRDIKSANIMITADGQAKVMDFGLAKLAGGTKLTKTGTTVGTIAYMSPEQARAEAVDHRTDVWSLGVVLYEMLTGQLPFKGDYNEAVVYSILNEAPEPVTALRTGVPMELERVVVKALEKEAGRRYQSARELLVDLKNVRDRELDGGALKPSSKPSTKPSSRLLRKVLIPAVVLLIVAIALVVGLRIQVGRQPAAVAAENSLAVMYFDNLADPDDPERLGEIAANLLITDLSESRFIQVVSGQRLYDILKLLGREGLKVIDRDVASEVADKANARWMLLGSILQSEPELILTAQLVEVSTGKAIASQRITGKPGEKIFSLVDKLTVEIKSDLSLPGGAERESDLPVANVTTHSPEAYRHYLEAIEYFSKLYYPEAEASYRRALEFDSTFAMAYHGLWGCTYGDESSAALAHAVKYSKKATRKERAYIRAAQAAEQRDEEKQIEEYKRIVAEYPEEKRAFRMLGNLHDYPDRVEEAIRYYERAIEIDPLYKLGYNDLAYAYNRMGDLDKSIWAIDQYISMAPDEANPYDSRAELYSLNGKLEEAIASYEKALQIKPDFTYTFARLGHLYLFSGQYEKAEEYYRKLASSKEAHNRSRGRMCLALIPIYRGKFEEALRVLDGGISADSMEQYEAYSALYKHALKSDIYMEQGKAHEAVREAKICVELSRKMAPDEPIGFEGFAAYCLARQGRIEEAEEIVAVLERRTELMDSTDMSYYVTALGRVESAKGNFDAAADFLERAVRLNPVFHMRYALGRAYLGAGGLGDAVGEFEKIILRYDEDRIMDTVAAVKVHYFLGKAYEQSGWTRKAIQQYEEFLDIWKEADPGIEEIEDAKARVARLRGSA